VFFCDRSGYPPSTYTWVVHIFFVIFFLWWKKVFFCLGKTGGKIWATKVYRGVGGTADLSGSTNIKSTYFFCLSSLNERGRFIPSTNCLNGVKLISIISCDTYTLSCQNIILYYIVYKVSIAKQIVIINVLNHNYLPLFYKTC